MDDSGGMLKALSSIYMWFVFSKIQVHIDTVHFPQSNHHPQRGCNSFLAGLGRSVRVTSQMETDLYVSNNLKIIITSVVHLLRIRVTNSYTIVRTC